MKFKLLKVLYRLGLYKPGSMIEAVVIRKDGTRENLGIIAFGPKSKMKASSK